MAWRSFGGALLAGALALNAGSFSAASAQQGEKGRTMATHFLTTSEGRIAYEDVGTGPVVLCVPGLGDLRGEYRYLAPGLVEAGYRVVSMDVRGHGESSVSWPDYSLAGIGKDIVALARHLDAGPVTVVGTSMAAGAAVWAAAEAPDRIGKLVLVGPVVRDGGPLWKSQVLSWPFIGPWGPSLWGMFYTTLYPTRKPADFDAYLHALRTNLGEPGRLAAMRGMIASSKSAAEERLAKVQAPSLIVMGTKDPDFSEPAVEAKRVADALKSSYVMIEGAGHYPHAEMPEVTTPHLVNFLRKGRTEGPHGS
ncbi:alpha/beta hydrolase [bacterium]|nr:alpha/beta hydrolase [bacterium]